ncbi:heavy metal translocating P-type ATPase [Maricaulis maris]|uniref:Cu2+-exporting ATPase n=1 Tax=Maricaulis maris TaxID=74318 RepID=A0A495D495_9PROT|nr:heavy metal translocating P-type ATPase [Maricaulis maris]RKQ95609.1 Cu2+-exporting ATPase [Maricaulis maris]
MAAIDVHADDAGLAGGADPQAFVRRKDDVAHLDLMVRGATCAGCIARIESGLKADERVETARLNLSTGRLALSWRGEAGLASGYVRLLGQLGYPATPYEPESDADPQREEEKRLLRAMAVAGFAMMNVMLLSISVWSGGLEMTDTMQALMHRISALIVLPAAAFAGQPFFRSALAALRGGHVNMDVPISLAVLLACSLSVWETFIGHGQTYYDAAVMLLFFLLIGRFLDMRLRARAGEAARGLAAMQAATANRLESDGSLRAIPAREVKAGDRLVLAAGDRVPVDARILEGEGALDGSLVTGETAPVTARPGLDVYSGMLNLDGKLVLEARADRDNSLLAEVTRLVEAGEQARSRYVRLADHAARLYVPVVHGLAALTLVGWLLIGGEVRPAIINAIAVLIITCPCALGLAVPAVQVVASGRLYREGVLVKSGDALERFAGVDTVVFDKTGTLTEGRPRLVNIGELPADALEQAARLARTSRHPLSRAIADAAGMGEAAAGVREQPGGGLEASRDGVPVRFGAARWLGITAQSDPHTEAWLQVGDSEPVRFRFEDRLRADALETVSGLTARGCHVLLLSGDRPGPVAAAAKALGVADWRAELQPQDKIAALEAIKAGGRSVAMIGDGINDAPALAAAHVSVSLASAAEISQAAADFVLQGDRLAACLVTLDISRGAKRRVLENFGLAAAYNAIAVPMAVAGLVTPLIAAIAMSASSVLVTLNALRLARGQS